MKSSLIKTLLVISAVTGLTGCPAPNNNQNIAPPAITCVGVGCVTGATGTAVPPTFTNGNTVVFNPVSTAVVGQYLGYPANTPFNFLVNIALNPTDSSKSKFDGTMTIQFEDGAVVHNGTFSNGNGNETYRGYDQSVNGLVGNTYRIFFEDPYGAIVLTMKAQTGTDTSSPWTGNIYFMNFNTSAPNPLYQGAYDNFGTYFAPGLIFCWMIDYGPYDCQNFNVPPTTAMKNKQGDWTAPAFTLLGTIPSIDPHKALGI